MASFDREKKQIEGKNYENTKQNYIYLRREKMGVIYGITWYTMSLAMPCIFSLNSVIKNTLERKPTERQRADTLFWLKYWVVFAYYYVMESLFDCIIAWLPLYNEVRSGPDIRGKR